MHFPLLGIFQGYVTKINLSRSGSNFPKIINMVKEFKRKEFEHAEMSCFKGLLEISFGGTFGVFSPQKRETRIRRIRGFVYLCLYLDGDVFAIQTFGCNFRNKEIKTENLRNRIRKTRDEKHSTESGQK